ncbi:unnamed protein product [Diatraea saccharalis]|uniref:Gustatory receptor n=1 Tax=Diatraea saccharalis TaxID=40085 RepID=A0A9N9RAJ4_9NEOP|nr:unnamed protein product [Diatraea saccharalis]
MVVQITPQKFFHDNNVDDDIRSFVLCLDITQNAMLLRKYSIRNNFITPNGWRSNMISTVGLLSYFFIYHYTCNSFYKNKVFFESALGKYAALNKVVVFIVFSIHVFSNMLHSKNNVTAITKLQNIRRVAKYLNNDLKQLIRLNWICLLFYIIFLITIEIALIYCLKSYAFFIILCHYVAISFEVGIIYFVCLARLLRHLMANWILKCKYYSEYSNFKICCDNINNSRFWNKLFKAYCDIIDSYQSLKKTATVSVSKILLD